MENQVQYKFLDIDGVSTLKEEFDKIINDSKDEIDTRFENVLTITAQSLTDDQKVQVKDNLGIPNSSAVVMKTWTINDMV